jgi:hypothetical protein
MLTSANALRSCPHLLLHVQAKRNRSRLAPRTQGALPSRQHIWTALSAPPATHFTPLLSGHSLR